MRDYGRIARKITAVLFLSQSLSSAGFIAAFTVNALVAVDLTGRTAMAGVPGALYVLGQACGAMAWGFSMGLTAAAAAAVPLILTTWWQVAVAHNKREGMEAT